MTCARRSAGFSLVEASIASVVLAVLVVGAMQTLGAIAKARQAYTDLARADALAGALASEIRAANYADPTTPNAALGLDGGESTASRATLDDVDDYQDLFEKPPTALDGSPSAPAGGWTRSVGVEWITRDTGGKLSVSASDTGFKRITVTVLRHDKPLAQRIFVRTSGWDAAKP